MKRALLAASCVVASVLATAPSATAAFPHNASPPGQIYVVSINAMQAKTIGVKRFEMMLELARSVLKRPPAFDGGGIEVGAAPDIIVLQEMRPANQEIFANLLRQRSNFNYQIVGSTETYSKFIVNADKVTLQGTPHLWSDVCYTAVSGDEEGAVAPAHRQYQWAEFTETETGKPFALAGVHFSKGYVSTGEQFCLERNVEEIHRRLEVAQVPAIIAGDFNRRAMQDVYECDPEEDSAPLPWWLNLTAPAQGRPYVDAVRSWHETAHLSMAGEWTHEQKAASTNCDASTRFRRSRIDYMFATGLEVAAAHTDHPGWAGVQPGSRHPRNHKYSDHRFLTGRFALPGPARPEPPVAVPQANGIIQLSWQPAAVPVAEWLVYRARGATPYNLLARLTPETTTYSDFATEHGVTYRYALAAVGPDTAQSVESRPARATADDEGPVVTSRTPGRNAPGIERRTDITARFDERVDPDSVSINTINVYRKGRSLCGRTVQETRRALVFDPCFPLGKKKEYRVVVFGVADMLGNRGFRDSWTFTTR